MAPTTQTRQINIVVVSKGDGAIKETTRALGEMNKKVKSIAGDVSIFKNAFIGFISISTLSSITQMADSIQLLRDRIATLSGGTENANQILENLTQAANRTKISVSTLSDVYAKLAATTKNLNLSQDALLGVTETLQNTFRLSGATGQEAANASLQLAQGLAVGVLRGQDLKSVLSQNIEFGDILAKTFNVQRGEILKLAEQGYFTAAKVLKALALNQEEVNKRAGSLGQTFGQTLIVAMNNFTLGVGKVNDSLGLSKGFAFLMEQAGKYTVSLTVFVGALAIGLVSSLLPAIISVGKALTLVFISNPILAVLTGALLLVGLLIRDFERFGVLANKLGSYIGNVVLSFKQLALGVAEYTGASEATKKSLQESIRLTERSIAVLKFKGDFEIQAALKSREAARQEAKIKKDLQDLANRPTPEIKKAQTLKEILGELNKLYLANAISAKEYFSRLNDFELVRLNFNLRKGKIDLEAYNDGLLKIKLVKLNQEFAGTTKSILEYNAALDTANLTNLNNKVDAGAVSLAQYATEFNKLSTKFSTSQVFVQGANDYITSIGTTASNVADAIKSTFSGLEDQLTTFILKGKSDFKSFANSILDDLAKIIIRAAIIRPLAQGVLDFAGGFNTATPGNSAGGSGTNTSVIAAKGYAFDHGLKKFATGGVVNSPTTFGYGKGQKGLMGEAGPEAILPLSRGANGNLGVTATVTPITVNIVNNSGSEVETRESTGSNGERTIDVLIQGRVKSGIADGSFDKALSQSYGLRRRGS